MLKSGDDLVTITKNSNFDRNIYVVLLKKLLKIIANLYEILGIVLEYRIKYEMMQMSMLTRLV